MDPLTIMLLSQAIPTLINTGKAIGQNAKAKKLSKTERPSWQIPEAVKQQVNQAKYLASLRELPGQNVMEGKIGENLGKGISELKNVSANPADLASNIAKMYSGSNDAINNIGLSAGQQWLQNQGLLNQNLGMLGQYQDKQFDINEMQPYKNDMAASSALREGAFRNLSSAGQNIASGIGGYANMMYQQQMLDKLMGGNKGGATEGFAGEVMPGANKTSGNYQVPVKTMTEASQTPIISEDFTQGGVANNKKLLEFLLNQ